MRDSGVSIVREPQEGWVWASHATPALEGAPANSPGALYNVHYLHMHYMLELGILLSGKVRHYYSSGWQVDLEPGDVWLCGVWERHGFLHEEPYERLCLYVLPPVLMRLNLEGSPPVDWTLPFKVPPRQRPRTSPATRPALLEIARRACEKRHQEREYSARHHAWYLLLLQEALLVLWQEWQPPAGSTPFLQADHATISEAVEMVLASRALLRSQEVARACGMSRNVFARRFQEFTGISFTEFCRRHRLNGAAEQLLRTTDSIKSIAHDWGFAHVSHLHRCFHRYYRCSPAQYRERGR